MSDSGHNRHPSCIHILLFIGRGRGSGGRHGLPVGSGSERIDGPQVQLR